MTSKGKLIIIPSTIAEGTQHKVIPLQVKNELRGVHHFIVENIRTARRYLSSLGIYDSIQDLTFHVLDKDTKETELAELFQPVNNGQNLGVLSESGCPGVADPGALAVKYAHEQNITVLPLVGPSSILLALISSGLNGQQFAFHGYLPIEAKEREKAIRESEKESLHKRQTQIFIETPYRNTTLFQSLLKNLRGETKLCIAIDLTGEHEQIKTLSVKEWKLKAIDLPKLPAIFLLLAASQKS